MLLTWQTNWPNYHLSMTDKLVGSHLDQFKYVPAQISPIHAWLKETWITWIQSKKLVLYEQPILRTSYILVDWDGIWAYISSAPKAKNRGKALVKMNWAKDSNQKSMVVSILDEWSICFTLRVWSHMLQWWLCLPFIFT